MPKSVRRKTAPNDVPALFFASVLIIMYWGFCSLGSVFSSALLGIVPVLWVVGLRQLPWRRVRSRWQWRSFLSCVLAFSLSLGILFSAGYWRWWVFLVFIVFGYHSYWNATASMDKPLYVTFLCYYGLALALKIPF